MKQLDATTWKHYSYSVSLENPIEIAGVNAYRSANPRYISRDKAGVVIGEAFSLDQSKKDIRYHMTSNQEVKP